MENSVYKIAFVSDMIFDLCVNRTMLISTERHIGEEDRDWFDMRLREAIGMVRQQINFLLLDDSDEFCFSLMGKYRFHQTLLPIKIENCLVATICENWSREYLLQDSNIAEEAFGELRSIALKQNTRFNRNSNC